MKVFLLNNGYLNTDSNNVVANSTLCTRTNPNVLHTFYRLPIMCVLIIHDGHKILYDTGSNPLAMKGYWPKCLQETYELHQSIEQNLEIQLAYCNVRAEEIDTVILSHMHFDHTGNIHLFKNADFYVPKKDFMFAQTTVRLSPNPETYCGYSKNDLDVQVKQYHLIENDFEFLPGVDIINLPGHTPGLLGLVVHCEKDGILIFPMDAVYTNEIYGPPAKASGLLHNREEYFSSIEKVRYLQKRYNAKVIPAHDWELFKTLKKAPQYYE
jgi:beta-lactamase domain protein